LNQDSDECRHINNILIAVSLAPGGATAKYGRIASQQIQNLDLSRKVQSGNTQSLELDEI